MHKSVKLPWEGAFYTYIEQSVNQCDRIYKPVCECTKDGKNCIKTGTSSDEILLISFSSYPFLLLTSTSSSSAILQFFTSRSHSYRVQISLLHVHCHNNITISSYIRRGKAKRDELVYLKNNKKNPEGYVCT